MTEPVAPLACLPPGLTPEEADFVYHAEVLGLPQRRAAQLANLPLSRMGDDLLVQARALVRQQMRGDLRVTKEDATYGIKEAIHRASLLAEPMTEIAGWDRLIKLHGLDAPQQIDINLKASVQSLSVQVRSLSDADLIKALGAGNVIDAEFYVKEKASDR